MRSGSAAGAAAEAWADEDMANACFRSVEEEEAASMEWRQMIQIQEIPQKDLGGLDFLGRVQNMPSTWLGMIDSSQG